MLSTNHQLDCIVLLWIHRCLPKQINLIPRSIVSAPIDDDEDSPVEEMSPVKAKKPLRRASKAKEKEPPKYWTTTKEITLYEAWCDVSENSERGNNMKMKGF
ncbi:hypothetical protein Tco_0998856 [Tanacetum coccineum]